MNTNEEKKTKRGHILTTPQTCDCDKQSDIPCPVCDWGLGICKVCGAAEVELDERDCPNKVVWKRIL